MTPILAAGFGQVSASYHVSTQDVAYTTGLYMLGLGLGSVIMSPTAILYGKRPVYLVGAILFILSAVWCALSPNYPSLVLARIFQGIAVSPVECLPSATVAEIYFLHERAYRIGIYTLLLLGGKNLLPLVSAAVIGSLGWRWVFWVVAIVVGGSLGLLFFFVPETFWDRTPRPRKPSSRRPHLPGSVSDLVASGFRGRPPYAQRLDDAENVGGSATPANRHGGATRVGFVEEALASEKNDEKNDDIGGVEVFDKDASTTNQDKSEVKPHTATQSQPDSTATAAAVYLESAKTPQGTGNDSASVSMAMHYTNRLREQPRMSFLQTLRPVNGRIAHDNWLRVAMRPFILFAYPSVLWSAAVYSLSIGWLIVISEVVANIYQGRQNYNFTSLQTGLIYISPFVGALLGTGVAGKVSDIIVRFMARRNGGVYEPEFRLIMTIPIALSTTLGMMGFGWSAQVKDSWIIPTIFFGIVSFGCSLGSTTSISFCVDSYRQYAGEALVTLNFSKSELSLFS